MQIPGDGIFGCYRRVRIWKDFSERIFECSINYRHIFLIIKVAVVGGVAVGESSTVPVFFIYLPFFIALFLF